MLNRTSILTLATVATLGLAALATTDASARGFGGGHGGGGHVAGGGHVGGGNFGRGGGTHVSFNNFRRGGGRPGGHPGGRPGGHRGGHPWPPIFVKHWHWRHHWWVPAVETAGVVGTTYAATSSGEAAADPAPCNCLTKSYMPDGTVVFKDLCTKEMAMASPTDEQAMQNEQQSQ